jgi:hypothetical protein
VATTQASATQSMVDIQVDSSVAASITNKLGFPA